MRVVEIDPANTAMIVLDMQNDFVAAGAPMEVLNQPIGHIGRRGRIH